MQNFSPKSFAKSSLMLTLLFITALCCQTSEANELEDQRGSLQQVKKQITDTAGQLKKKKAAERSALQQLEHLDNQISSNNSALISAAATLDESRKKVKELKEKILRYQTILNRSQRSVEKRLKALYTSGEISSLRLAFSTETPLELAENMNFLGRISSHDKKLLSSYRHRMTQLNQAQTDLEQQMAQQQQTFQEQKDKKRQLAVSRSQRKQLISSIRRDTTSLSSLLTELEDRSARMTELIESMEKKQALAYQPLVNSRSFLSGKGKIPWPSSGAVRSNFGTQKDKSFGSQLKSNGLVIAAVPGTRIKAIWPGRIAFSSPFKGYGNLIIVDHGNQYYSLYAQAAHLNLAVGTVVKQGDILTTSGFEGRDSYYLEIRHGGTPVNPRKWLQPRAR